MVTTKYIGFSSSNCDFVCDGTADQVQINQAFLWAKSNPGNILVMRYGNNGRYNITDQIFAASNTKWTAEAGVTLFVPDGACGSSVSNCVWPDGTPVIAQISGTYIHDFEMYGFAIDGNCNNQNTKLGYAHGKLSSAGSGVERLIGFYGSASNQVKNIYIHDITAKNSFGEFVLVRYGQNIRVEDCGCENHQHCGIFFKAVTGPGTAVRRCKIKAITSDGVRFDNSAEGVIEYNEIEPYTGSDNNGAAERGAQGIQIANASGYSTQTNNIEVSNNKITGNLAGIWIHDELKTAGTASQTVYVHHNDISGNGWASWASWCGGISVQWGNGLTIEKNTIDGSYCEGILVYGRITSSACTIAVKNNNITNTVKNRAGSSGYPSVLGYGIANLVSTTVTVVASGNYFYNNISGNCYKVTSSTETTSLISDAVPSGGTSTSDDDAADVSGNTSGKYLNDTGIYIPPTSSIIDDEYYVERAEDDFQAYLNKIPLGIQSYGGSGQKILGETKSPSVDGTSISDFGFDGANLTLNCTVDNREDYFKILSSFYSQGHSTLELGGRWKGYKVVGTGANHACDDSVLDGDWLLSNWEYKLVFKCERPYMEWLMPRVRGKYISGDITYTADDIKVGNKALNSSFESWTPYSKLDWILHSTPADNEFRAVKYSPELNQFCAIASSGTNNTIMISPGKVQDRSSNNCDGTIYGGVYYLDEGGMEFNGADGYISIGGNLISALSNTDPNTICARFRLNADGSDSPYSQCIANSRYIRLYVRNSDNSVRIRCDDPYIDVGHELGEGDREEHTAVGTYNYDGTHIIFNLYVDGILVGSETTESSAPTTIYQAKIGSYTSDAYYNGDIFDVRIYKRVFSASEALDYHNRVTIDNTNLFVQYSPTISDCGNTWYIPSGLTNAANCNNILRGLEWCNEWGLWVASSVSGLAGYAALSSPDGNAWTERATPTKYGIEKEISGLSGPRGVAISPDGNTAYICNYSGGSVSVVDLTNNTITATVTVGNNPRNISFSNAGTKAAVCNYSDNTISIIDVATSTVTNTISVGTGPVSCCYNLSDSKIYVTCSDSNSVSIVTVASNTVTNTISVGSGPYGIVLHPAGTYLYVSCNSEGIVHVLSTSTESSTATILVGSAPSGIDITPDGSKAYVSNSGSNTVSVIDTASNTTTATINVGTSPSAVKIDNSGTFGYALNRGSNSYSVIDTATNTITETITASVSPFWLGIRKRDNKLFISNYESNTVYAMHTMTAEGMSWGNLLWIPPNDLVPNGRLLFFAYAGTGYRCMFTDDQLATWSFVPTINDTTNWIRSDYAPELNRIVVISYSGTSGAQAMYSDNCGSSWNVSTTPTPNRSWTDINWADLWGLFVCCSSTDTDEYQIMTSPTGLPNSWTLRSVPYTGTSTSGGGTTSRSLTDSSPEGSNYTTKYLTYQKEYTFTLPALTDGSAYRIDQVFCHMRALSSAITASVKVTAKIGNGAETTIKEWTTSSTSYTPKTYDLATETSSEIILTFYIKTSNAAYKAGATLFGYNISVQTSIGSTITYNYNQWRALAFTRAFSLMVCVAQTGTGNRVIYTKNGINWILSATPADNNWFAACFADELEKFVAVSTTGTGNRVMTSEGYGKLVSPDNWTAETPGQSRSSVSVEDGQYSLMIEADGLEEQPGRTTQPLYFDSVYDSDEMYILSVPAKVEGLVSGKYVADIYAGGQLVKVLEWDANTDDFERKHIQFKFDQVPTVVYARVRGDSTPNYGSRCYFDDVIISKRSDLEIETNGNGIITDGYVNVIPDVTIRGVGTNTASTSSSRLITDTTDANEILKTDSKSYVELASVVLPALTGGSVYKIESLSFKIKSSSAKNYTYMYITVQAASLFGGVEKAIALYTTNKTEDWYEKEYTLPYSLLSATNETVTIRYYMHRSVNASASSGYVSFAKELGYKVTEIIAQESIQNTGIYLYNTADSSKVMHCCNALPRGYIAKLNSNYTGSYRYVEPFVDDTYEDNAYSSSGSISRDEDKCSLVMSADSEIVFPFSTLYPVTSVPFLKLYVYAGIPQIYIADDSGEDGAPGTFYAVDGQSSADITNTSKQWSLINKNNLQLRGKTKYYVKIAPKSGESCEISQLLEYCTMDTTDADRFFIYWNKSVNTIGVILDGDGKCSAIVELKYYAANIMGA